MKYRYYEKDGATFRGEEGVPGISEVWAGGKWVDYQGDCMAPSTFGSRITAKEAGETEDTTEEGKE